MNPAELIARGVFDSIEDLELVISEEATHQRAAIRYRFPHNTHPGAAQAFAAGRAAAPVPAAAPALVGDYSPLCIWCAMERALQGHGSAPTFRGLHRLEACARHSSPCNRS